MKRTNSSTAGSTRWLAPALAVATLLTPGAVLTLLATSTPTVAAQQRGPVERVAEGKVVSKSDAPVAGAIVYLKDTKSLSVKTFIADDEGHFRFGQLTQSADYEIWAESAGQRSKSKGISSFDSASTFNFTLKIATAK